MHRPMNTHFIPLDSWNHQKKLAPFTITRQVSLSKNLKYIFFEI